MKIEGRYRPVTLLLQYLSYVAKHDMDIAYMSQFGITFGLNCDLVRRVLRRNREQSMRLAAMFRAFVMCMLLRPRWVRMGVARQIRMTTKIAFSCSGNMRLSRYMFGCERTEDCKRQSVLVAKVGATDCRKFPLQETLRSYSRLTDVSRNQYEAPVPPPVSAMTDIKPYAG